MVLRWSARAIARQFSMSASQICKNHSKTIMQSGAYVSKCDDIYDNLALEDWIYEHVDMQDKAIMLIWRNNPAVVIGRHQNIWAEVSLKNTRKLNIPVVRRKSGGGTVYHDMGNVNISFMTDRKSYDRKANLELLTQVLRDKWKLNVAPNSRDDLLLDDKYKISGTAAKLGVRTAYHHLTLLLNVDTTALYSLLKPDIEGICTKATTSVRSRVCNLQDVLPVLTYERFVPTLTSAYAKSIKVEPRYTYVDPLDENEFPGISKIKEELRSWNWTFTKTPKFQVKRGIIEYVETLGRLIDIDITIEVDKGLIAGIILASNTLRHLEQCQTHLNSVLCGVKFSSETVSHALRAVIYETDPADKEWSSFQHESQWVESILVKHMLVYS